MPYRFVANGLTHFATLLSKKLRGNYKMMHIFFLILFNSVESTSQYGVVLYHIKTSLRQNITLGSSVKLGVNLHFHSCFMTSCITEPNNIICLMCQLHA